MLRFDVESYASTAGELAPLLRRHFEEIALDREAVPLDVDHQRYLDLEAVQGLVLITARAGRKLVGYIAAFVGSNPHNHSTKFGSIDVFWMDPTHRAGVNGLGLFTALEAELKRRGVVKVVGQTKLAPDQDVSRLYTFLGWQPVELLFAKML